MYDMLYIDARNGPVEQKLLFMILGARVVTPSTSRTLEFE